MKCYDCGAPATKHLPYAYSELFEKPDSQNVFCDECAEYNSENGGGEIYNLESH